MIVTLAGHVDHGKTALVHALTGIDTDRLEVEKKRGLTIELGFAYADFGGERIGFVDVPGHQKFIRTMIAGISSEQFAMLVIAADKGVKPQTVEHLDILETIGITRGMVVFSRADRASMEQRDKTLAAARALLAESFLQDAKTVWCSAHSGEGIELVKQALASAARGTRRESSETHFRLCVDRAFHLSGAGLVVTGAVHSGKASVGEALATSRGTRPVRIRSMRVLDQDATSTHQGDRAAVNITGIDLNEVKRGDWLLPAHTCTPTKRVSLAFRALRRLPHLLSRWTSVHLHHGAARFTGRLRLASASLLQAGETHLVDCLLDEPIVAKWGDPVLIRDAASASTLGGGPVIDTCIAERSGRQWTRGRGELLAALALAGPIDSLRAVLAHRPVLTLAAFAAMRNLPEARLQDKLIASDTHCWEADGKRHVTLKRTLGQVRKEILQRIDAWHKAHPDEPGLRIETLRKTSNLHAELMRHTITQLIADKEILVQSGALQRPNFQSRRTPEETILARTLAEQDNRAPTLGDLGDMLAMTPHALRRAAKGLEATGELVFVNERRLVRQEVMREAIDLARQLESPQGFVVREFRDVSGLGRNACIDILEYLDRSGMTRRVGDRRFLNRR